MVIRLLTHLLLRRVTANLGGEERLLMTFRGFSGVDIPATAAWGETSDDVRETGEASVLWLPAGRQRGAEVVPQGNILMGQKLLAC